MDADGIGAPGEIIRPKDIYLNKQSPINTRDRFDHPMDLPDRYVILVAVERFAVFLAHERVFCQICPNFLPLGGLQNIQAISNLRRKFCWGDSLF